MGLHNELNQGFSGALILGNYLGNGKFLVHGPHPTSRSLNFSILLDFPSLPQAPRPQLLLGHRFQLLRHLQHLWVGGQQGDRLKAHRCPWGIADIQPPSMGGGGRMRGKHYTEYQSWTHAMTCYDQVQVLPVKKPFLSKSKSSKPMQLPTWFYPKPFYPKSFLHDHHHQHKYDQVKTPTPHPSWGTWGLALTSLSSARAWQPLNALAGLVSSKDWSLLPRVSRKNNTDALQRTTLRMVLECFRYPCSGEKDVPKPLVSDCHVMSCHVRFRWCSFGLTLPKYRAQSLILSPRLLQAGQVGSHLCLLPLQNHGSRSEGAIVWFR